MILRSLLIVATPWSAEEDKVPSVEHTCAHASERARGREREKKSEREREREKEGEIERETKRPKDNETKRERDWTLGVAHRSPLTSPVMHTRK